jgi:hypothetical protein
MAVDQSVINEFFYVSFEIFLTFKLFCFHFQKPGGIISLLDEAWYILF